MPATRVYECASIGAVEIHPVTHEPVREYQVALSALIHALGEDASGTYWTELLRPMRKWRFALATTPVPIRECVSQRAVNELKARYARCTQLFPEASHAYLRCLSALECLAACRDNPLMEQIRSVAERAWKTRIFAAVCDSNLTQRTQDALSTHPACRLIRVIGPAQLRGDRTASTLIVVGPPRWFPHYVFAAPRALAVSVVCFSWMRALPDPITFDPRALLGATIPKPVPQSAAAEHESFFTIADAILDQADLAEAVAHVAEQSTGSDSRELTRALPVLLEDGSVLFLDDDSDASMIVVDLSEKGKRRVKRAKVADLEVGTFVLVREGGGGDYIVPVANSILGHRCEECRARQAEWKGELRRLARLHGMPWMCRALLTRGSIRANDANIRRWMWDRSIRPHDFADFLAIMRLIGKEAEAQAYWKTMGLIDRAHARAGQLIRRLLIDNVLSADLDELEQFGRMSFALGNAATGNLLVCRVKELSAAPILIPPSRVGHVFDAEVMQWRE